MDDFLSESTLFIFLVAVFFIQYIINLVTTLIVIKRANGIKLGGNVMEDRKIEKIKKQ